MRKVKRKERNKAFLGAVIGAAASLLGGIGSSIIASNSAKKQQREQEAMQRRNANYQTAANISNYINGSSDIVDDYYNRVVLQRCGGRHKYEGGGGFDWNSTINGIGSALGSVGSSAISSTVPTGTQIIQPSAQQFTPKIYKPRNITPISTYDMLMSERRMRCGGRMKRRR